MSIPVLSCSVRCLRKRAEEKLSKHPLPSSFLLSPRFMKSHRETFLLASFSGAVEEDRGSSAPGKHHALAYQRFGAEPEPGNASLSSAQI